MSKTIVRPMPKAVKYKAALRLMTAEMQQLNKKIQEDQASIDEDQPQITQLREETRALLANIAVSEDKEKPL